MKIITKNTKEIVELFADDSLKIEIDNIETTILRVYGGKVLGKYSNFFEAFKVKEYILKNLDKKIINLNE